jgi:hypothetical protein
VQHRVVFGTRETVHQGLAACGWQINTSFIERLNLDIRQRVAAIGRRVTMLCQGEDGIQQQLVVYHAYHNFVLPHASLRRPLAEPIPTNDTGSARLWPPCTPALAAGLTDHVWSLTEVLRLRVPPWPQPQMVYDMVLVDDRGLERLTCARMQPKRGERGLEITFGVLMTGGCTRRRRIGRGPKTLSAASGYATA